MNIILTIIVLAGSIGIAIMLLAGGPDPTKTRVMSNLRRGSLMKEAKASTESVLDGQFFKKMLDTPERRTRYESLIARAGRPDTWTVDRVLSAKMLFALFFAMMFTLLTLKSGSTMMVILTVGTTVFTFFLPDLLLLNQGIKRRQAVDLEIADTLDQMSIAVQAGLGFDAAMVQVAKQGDGVLSSELVRTMQDIHVGMARRDAYEDLAVRTGSTPLKRFIRTIIQAESYGLPLSGVLHSQAAEMRRVRRQEAQRKAMQIPVKVLFPLMLFILPALFIVILGPAAIGIAEAFGGGAVK